MTEYDHQRRTEPVRGKLDAADLRGGHDVAGNSDHEQIAETLVEDDLGRDSRIRAPEDDGERFLRRRHFPAPGLTGFAPTVAQLGNETLVAFTQAFKRLESGVLGGV